MHVFSRFRRCYPLIVPILIVLGALLLVDKWPVLAQRAVAEKELRALILIFPDLPYAVFLSAILMGGFAQNAGMMLSAWIAGLVYFLLVSPAAGPLSLSAAQQRFPEGGMLVTAAMLFCCSLLNRRRLSLRMRVLWMIGIGGLICAGAFFAKVPIESPAWVNNIIYPAVIRPIEALRQAIGGYGAKFGLSGFSGQIFSLRFLFLAGLTGLMVFRYLKRNDMLLAGFAGLLVSVSLGLQPVNTRIAQAVYFSAGGLILMLTAIWSAFILAYHDELTGLPGRRSLNEALASLGKTYTIAMIDVDHFKKFNDTYGHKTGDQVLKWIAVRMRRISGGAHIYRYGGEEFTVLFSGKSVEGAVEHLETFREELAAAPFAVRGSTRKKGNAGQRSGGTGNRNKTVQVTVSIGVAMPEKNAKKPLDVIKAADKALYRAKKAGRNRVMV